MPKRSYRRSYRKTSSYSQQQTALSVVVPDATEAYSTDSFELVPTSTVQGKRTIAHLRVKVMTDTPLNVNPEYADGYAVGFGYTIQYVPSGFAVQTPTWNVTGELVAANQYIMAAGIWNPD